MRAVPGGRPVRPVVRWQGRPLPPPAMARVRRRSPPGTPRPLLPIFPSGRAGPPGRICLAARTARAAFPLFPFPRACSRRRMPAVTGPAGAGLDATGGAERSSSRRHGRTAPGNAYRSRLARRHPAGCTRRWR